MASVSTVSMTLLRPSSISYNQTYTHGICISCQYDTAKTQLYLLQPNVYTHGLCISCQYDTAKGLGPALSPTTKHILMASVSPVSMTLLRPSSISYNQTYTHGLCISCQYDTAKTQLYLLQANIYSWPLYLLSPSVSMTLLRPSSISYNQTYTHGLCISCQYDTAKAQLYLLQPNIILIASVSPVSMTLLRPSSISYNIQHIVMA